LRDSILERRAGFPEAVVIDFSHHRAKTRGIRRPQGDAVGVLPASKVHDIAAGAF